MNNPPIRAEYVLETAAPVAAVAQQHVHAISDLGWLRKLGMLAVIAVIWELVARYFDNDLLLPGAIQTGKAFAVGVASGELWGYISVSLKILTQGFVLGVIGSFLLTWPAVS